MDRGVGAVRGEHTGFVREAARLCGSGIGGTVEFDVCGRGWSLPRWRGRKSIRIEGASILMARGKTAGRLRVVGLWAHEKGLRLLAARSDPDGIRTHVASVKGMCPGPG
jgi:hypothetical protein